MSTLDSISFIATVFPHKHDLPSLGKLKNQLTDEIKAATGQEPLFVHPDKTVLVLLISGEFKLITAALEKACDDDRWLLLRAETPHANYGLARAGGWIQSRVSHP